MEGGTLRLERNLKGHLLQVAFIPYRVGLKDEHPTSNVQRRTSNNDVASLRNLISFVYYFCFFIFSHSTFDVGRSMFDVHPFSVRPARNALKPI